MEIDSHIESIVADAALTHAYKQKRRSKRWRKLIRLPHISQCKEIDEAGVSMTYDFIVQKQPIGRELFKLFCQNTNPIYSRCQSFLQAVRAFESCQEVDQINSLNNILWKYLSRSHVVPEKTESEANDPISVLEDANDASVSDTDAVLTVKNNFIDIFSQETLQSTTEAIKDNESSDPFLECVKEIKTYLSKEPFEEFKNSMYFRRYFQWVWLEKRPISDESFWAFRTLGKGGFGEVCAVQNRISGKMYACKRFNKKKIKKHHRETLLINEKKMLEMVNSEFVVNLAYAFQTKYELCLIVTLMMGGTLHFHIKYIHNNKKTGVYGLPESSAKFYAAQILLGLRDLHSYKIVHRDLKPENILMDEWGHMRITDLGLAKEIIDNVAITSGGGTKGYIAPEVKKKEPYTYSPDFFSLGCVIFEMIEGKQLIKRKKECLKEGNDIYSSKFSGEAVNLCKLLLQSKIADRIGYTSDHKGANEVMKHLWFTSINWKRMERLKDTPPFIPDPNIVYATSVNDLVTVYRTNLRGIRIREEDEEMYDDFNTGAVSVQWQEEMIESRIFHDLNKFGPDNTLPRDLDVNYMLKFPEPIKGKSENTMYQELQSF